MRKLHLLTAVVLCILIAAAACLSAGALSYLCGDADGDGTVTILDATAIQRVLAGLRDDSDGSIAQRCSVTGDSLNIMDATAIQRYLAHYEDPHNIGAVIDDDGQILVPSAPNQLPILT